MFHVPLDTLMEPVHTLDAGKAIASAVESSEIWGETLNIAGGNRCRTDYRKFLGSMMDIFGIGMLPDEAFSRGPFHMGYMDTEKSEELLKYQSKALNDLFAEARAKKRFLAALARMTRPLARRYLLSKSVFYNKKKG
jgi:hypothetical protein